MLRNKTIDDLSCFTIVENGFMIAFNHPDIDCLFENLQQDSKKEVPQINVNFNSVIVYTPSKGNTRTNYETVDSLLFNSST